MTLPVSVMADGLGKRYRLGERAPYRALRDVLTDGMRTRRARPDWLWALREVSFEVPQGQSLGIIGRNGAGKSTLLKVLARITEPTEGLATVRGRVGALLDVGTGFHPELTGRENVLLNAAVLGMRRAEILSRFDAIVDFAGVERFMDTPVKRYSAGMRARLAFSVAAHLEPDVLVVDEVLAVGDAEFQRRCLGKMGEAARGGRTVLFVSHNMAAVESLCDRVLWLDAGRVIEDGTPGEVAGRYLATSFAAQNDRDFSAEPEPPGNAHVRLRRALVRAEDTGPEAPIHVDVPFRLEFELASLDDRARVNLSLHVYDANGVLVFNAVPVTSPWFGAEYPRGTYREICHVPGNLLNDGLYTVELLVVHDGTRVVWSDREVLVFEIRDRVAEAGVYEPWAGVVRPRLQWETERTGDVA